MFPTTIYDGLGGNNSRDYDYDHVAPSAADWDVFLEEIQAIQNHLITLKDADGNILQAPLVTKGTDPAYIMWGPYYKITIKDMIVAVGSSAVASKATGYTIPANSVVFGASMNIESAITLATATKVGLGVAADLDKYGKITGGSANAKFTTPCTPTAVVATEPLLVYAVDNSGDAAGTIQNGSVRIHLVFGTLAALPDA